MMENVLSFLRAAAPWISLGLLIAFLCVRPAIRKGKAEDDYAEEGMCVGMCLGLMLGSLSDSNNSGLGASLGMLFGLLIGLCMHKKGSCIFCSYHFPINTWFNMYQIYLYDS